MPRCEAEDYALNLVRTGHRHVKVYRAAQTPSFVTDDLLLELVAK
jgi:hypothetical protein